MELTDLVASVETTANGGDSLSQLNAAVAVSRELESLADNLVDHFVQRARSAEVSWGAIGARLGTQQQSARSRFAERASIRVVDGKDADLAPRLLLCLDRAAEEARLDGSGEIGAHHLLLGLLEEGMPAAALDRAGVRTEDVRATAVTLFGKQGTAQERAPEASEEVRGVLERTRYMAHEHSLGGIVTPQHLLCALVSDPGGRAVRVMNELKVDIRAVHQEVSQHIVGHKKRRRRDRQGDLTCSFCSRSETAAGPLAAGRGVRICADCAATALGSLQRPVDPAYT